MVKELKQKLHATVISETDDMEISITNADVGEEVEATTIVAAVGVETGENEIYLLKLSKAIEPPMQCVHWQHFIGLTGILFMMIIFKISHCDD